MPGLSSGLRARNQNQLTAVQFAPTANIAIAELEEKDRTVISRQFAGGTVLCRESICTKDSG
jgi:hypothetical protein